MTIQHDWSQTIWNLYITRLYRCFSNDNEANYTESGQNSGLVDQQQKLQERLGTIVRSKEW